jgi:hypothetical protein
LVTFSAIHRFEIDKFVKSLRLKPQSFVCFGIVQRRGKDSIITTFCCYLMLCEEYLNCYLMF